MDIETLRKRYEHHPASVASMWRPEIAATIAPDFRAHGHYVWQDKHDREAYERSYWDLHERYPDLMDSALEDGRFGARCEVVDGRPISRDLLDSVAEIGFLRDALGGLESTRFLDIGAGYGRLGHRIDELCPPTTSMRCVDGIPESSLISQAYLSHRGVSRASVVLLDEIEASLVSEPADVAINVHSFPEMPLAAVRWWVEILVRHEVNGLLIVPNELDDLRSTEQDGSRKDIVPVLDEAGFSITFEGLKYRAERSSATHHVVFQDQLLLLTR